MGGVLEKDPTPHLTARQEQAVQVLSSNKAPFRRYPKCFLVLVGLSPYYPFDENTYPAFERPDKTGRTADPRKVQAVEVQKGEEQVKLLDSIKHCFVSLDAPAVVQQEGGSGSGTGPEVSASSAEENVVAGENVISVGTYLDLMDPEGDLTVAEKGDAARKQPEKAKRKKLLKQSDTLPAKRLRVDHPSLASGTGGKTLASLRWTIPEGSLLLRPSSQADVHTQVTVRSSRVGDAPVYTAADTVTFSRGKTLAAPTSDVGGVKDLLEIVRLNSLVGRRSGVRGRVPSREQFLFCLRFYSSFFFAILKRDGKSSKRRRFPGDCYNVWSKLKACMDVSLAMVKCLKSPEYQGILGHALGRAMDFGMQEGLAAGHEHGVVGTPLSAVTAYNPKTAEANYLDAVRALEEADFPLVHLLKSRKIRGWMSVLDFFIFADSFGPLILFALLTVSHQCRRQVRKKHAAALRQLMVDIVSHPLSSQNLLGEASTSTAAFFVEDLDTDEDLGSVSLSLLCSFSSDSLLIRSLPLGSSCAFTWHDLLHCCGHRTVWESSSNLCFFHQSLAFIPSPKLLFCSFKTRHLLAGVSRNKANGDHCLSKLPNNVDPATTSSLLPVMEVVAWECPTHRIHGPKKDFLYRVPLIMVYLAALRRTTLAFFLSSGRISFASLPCSLCRLHRMKRPVNKGHRLGSSCGFAGRAEISAKKETPVNFLTDPSDERSTLRPADVLVFGWVEGKHACVDLTGVSPLVGLSSRGFTAGQAALKAASYKVTKHAKACIENQHVFIPFAFDTFGFLCTGGGGATKPSSTGYVQQCYDT
ncbi:hypothetical protein Tco_1254415 [Tanacetum coccineum]